MNKNIIFIPYHIRHWEMYLPLVKPLEQAGCKVHFIVINGFHYIHHHPDLSLYQSLNIEQIEITKKGAEGNKVQFLYLIFKELLPQWRVIVRNIRSGIIISPDYGTIHRLMLNNTRKYNFIKIALQDGYIIGNIGKSGNSLESAYKKLVKKILIRTPFKFLVNLELGAYADYIGVFGDKMKRDIINNNGFNATNVKVIGNTRLQHLKSSEFKNPISSKNEYKILCLPTIYESYKNKQLGIAQDEGLKWVLKAAKFLSERNNWNISILVKPKPGYDSYFSHYETLLKDPIVTVLKGNTNVFELINQSTLIITTGGTSALESVICNKATIQVAPEYLSLKVKFIYGIPVVKSFDDLLKYMELAIMNQAGFCQNYCYEAREELADIDPNWNSIDETTNWLLELVDSPTETQCSRQYS